MTEPPASDTSAFPVITLPATDSDLASALAALEQGREQHACSTRRRMTRRARRAVLAVAFVVVLIGGVVNLVTSTAASPDRTAGGSRASIVYANAQRGACLNWPPNSPDKPSFVQCRAKHMFEVARPLGSASSEESCQLAVRDYLGAHYDPNTRFAIRSLSAGDADGTRASDQQALCGLQLLGPQGQPIPFPGSVAELDQSKVWPAGTCLGIDSANRSTDIPVGCAMPHALEVTGAVNLAERFPGEAPAEANQRAYLGAICSELADAYLTPATLLSSGLAMGYEPLSPASWAAGSKRVSCSVGKPGVQGWIAAVGSARTPPTAVTPSPGTSTPPPPVIPEPLATPVAPPPPPPPPPLPAPATTAETPGPTETTAPAETPVPTETPLPAETPAPTEPPAPSPPPSTEPAPPPAPAPEPAPTPEPQGPLPGPPETLGPLPGPPPA